MVKRAKLDPDFRAALDGSAKAYTRGSEEFFNYFTEDAVVYSLMSSEPLIGRMAYAAQFRTMLTAEKRTLKVLAEDFQQMGGQILGARTVQITQGGVTVNARQSQVWVKTEDGWKMQHLHTAMIGSPAAAKTPTSTRAVRVLNERIATVASVWALPSKQCSLSCRG